MNPFPRAFATSVGVVAAQTSRRAVLAAALVVGSVLTDAPRDLDAQNSGNGGSEAPPAGQLRSPYPALIPGMAAVPFTVGEKLDYDVKFGVLKVGSGSMEVKDIVEVRGRPSWHTVFTITGGVPLFRVNDRMESWFDVFTLNSRRFHQRISEGNYKRNRLYEFFPERSVFRENDGPEEESVSNPLDDASFLYYVRTIPLEVGKTYEVPRYFNPKSNPVRIRVLRKEKIRVPAGEFETVVVQPTFQSRGIFAEDGRAEVWITDDPWRMMVQMKTRLSFGSLNLFLRTYSLPPGPSGQTGQR